ncbi:radical SAM protein [Tunturibacter empetritectus]|uniref:MoaA/NifB/PqqE/SkfB family radical SAM enzyme n=3 Tax=Tunturiibacter empetritectus TaxID=3069691 RepID=A0A7W8MQX5_9BACT|nr:MoaA/NifB/PqqE/SkfB family radical SAM enzyme [Edaphobacter lichenicola]
MLSSSDDLWLWIDSSSACNLACKLCYTTDMQGSDNMREDTLVVILKRVAESGLKLQALHLNWRGEPTLNPDLPLLLQRTEEHLPYFPVQWHTNGTMLTPEFAAKLVDAHSAQTIIFSLDGGTKESFERNRGAGNWQRALDGLEMVMERARERTGVKVGVYSIDLGVSPDRFDTRFTRLASLADFHVIMPPVRKDGSAGGSGTLVSLSELKAVPNGPCFWLGNAMAIDCHGIAFTCLLNGGTRLGDLRNESIQSLRERSRALRRSVELEGRRNISGCSKCRKIEGTAGSLQLISKASEASALDRSE